MEPRPRGPSRSAHPVGKRTPRKRDQVDITPESATIPSTASALPCKASRKNRYVDAGQQHPHPRTRTTRTGQKERSTSNTEEIAYAQIPVQREALKAKNEFVLCQRELLNPAAGRQEEAGDNFSHSHANGRLIPRPERYLSDEYVRAVAEAISAHNSQIQAVRAEVQDPKLRHEIFQKELKTLLSLKRDDMDDIDDARTYEGILLYRRAISAEKNRFPGLFRPSTRQKGRRRARAGAEAPTTPVPDRVVPSRVQSQGGATSDAPDPHGNTISKTEADMLHAYILDHPL